MNQLNLQSEGPFSHRTVILNFLSLSLPYRSRDPVKYLININLFIKLKLKNLHRTGERRGLYDWL